MIVIGIIFLISFSDEMATMAKEVGFLNALGSFVLIILIDLGARY